jgi:hypothetical protein
MRMLAAEADGVLDGLECPDCHIRVVSVRYTEPQKGVYRTWFMCSECAFQQRTQNSGKPAHFSADRVDSRLQAYDADILEKCIFRLSNEPPSP